ncbi:MAG: response regulator [Clostridia bacterium]|nr:response regulator [Clostridia bacterium]
MSYYSVILVDDEEEVREAIIRKVNWESIGFKVIDSAENGEEALEKAEKLCPDVVMTDIQMPFMDGLTFCKKLKETLSNTKIVIFSGYDEFEYAKEAIKLEAEEYILKPINSAELTQVFVRIKQRLDEELDQKRNLDRLRKYYMESIPMLREQLLISLLEGRVGKKEIVQIAESCNLRLTSPYYVVGVIKTDVQFDGDMVDAGLFSVSIKQMVEERLSKKFSYLCTNYLGNVAIIGLLKEKEELDVFIHILDQVCKISHRMLRINVTGGIGQITCNLEELYQSFQEAKDAIDYRILIEPNQAIFIHDIEPKADARFILDEKDIQSITRALKVGTKEELEEAVKDMMNVLKSSRITLAQLQSSFMELLVEITRLTRVYELDSDSVDQFQIDFYQEIRKFDSLDAIGEWLLSLCMQIRGMIRAERKDATKLLIEKAVCYMEENYSNSELSVEKICRFLNLSATYFSTLFKKETGLSFVAYLTKIRMEKALWMLDSTDEKAYVISEKVGYMEPNYFSYVFKKQFGISPSRYRSNKAGVNEE